MIDLVKLGPVTAREALGVANGLRAAHDALEAARRSGRVSAAKYAELQDLVKSASVTMATALTEIDKGEHIPRAMLQAPYTVRGVVSRALGVSLAVETRGGHAATERARTLRLARLREAEGQAAAHTEAGRAQTLADMRRKCRGR